jgi:hypothetical protein
MDKVNHFPAIESLEGRLLFAASTFDLAIEKVAAPTATICVSHHHVQGQPAAAKVQNLASEPVKAKFTIQFYLSKDQTLDSSDLLVGRASARVSLRAGASKGFVGSLQPKANTPDGKYYLFAVLKPSAGIVNADAAGNVALAAHRVSVLHSSGGNTNDNSTESSTDDSGTCLDTSDDGPPASDDNSSADTQPAPAPQPAPPPPPDTQPTTQPSDTQPATDPTPSDPAPSDPGSDPAPSSDSSSDGGDSGSDS